MIFPVPLSFQRDSSRNHRLGFHYRKLESIRMPHSSRRRSIERFDSFRNADSYMCNYVDCNLHGFPEEIETRNTWKYYRSSVEYAYSMVSRLHIFFTLPLVLFLSILLISLLKNISCTWFFSYRQEVVLIWKVIFIFHLFFLSFLLFFLFPSRWIRYRLNLPPF